MGWRVMLPGSELGETVDKTQHVVCNSGELRTLSSGASIFAQPRPAQPNPAHDPIAFTEIM